MKHAALAAASLSVLSITQAGAMPHCGDRDAVTEALSDRYAERHIASGLQSDTGLLDTWASESEGSWTILTTRPDGQTCVVASVAHWLSRDSVPEIQGEPA